MDYRQLEYSGLKVSELSQPAAYVYWQLSVPGSEPVILRTLSCLILFPVEVLDVHRLVARLLLLSASGCAVSAFSATLADTADARRTLASLQRLVASPPPNAADATPRSVHCNNATLVKTAEWDFR
jgi:hypothetical protein